MAYEIGVKHYIYEPLGLSQRAHFIDTEVVWNSIVVTSEWDLALRFVKDPDSLHYMPCFSREMDRYNQGIIIRKVHFRRL